MRIGLISILILILLILIFLVILKFLIKNFKQIISQFGKFLLCILGFIFIYIPKKIYICLKKTANYLKIISKKCKTTFRVIKFKYLSFRSET